MESTGCSVCLKPKAPYQCGICDCTLCKKCARFIDPEDYTFYRKVPEVLTKGIYCNPCFDSQVQPEIDKFDDIMARAAEVYIFDTTQGKETRLYKRDETPLKVVHCDDEKETVMRLAFMAAQKGYNGIVDMDVSYEKIKSGAYQIMKWNGTAVPTQVDEAKINRKVPAKYQYFGN